tara:strand:+ start:344 stop:1687 length:1344 start_codon:yes stop_codon:yes gene_type:complete
MADKNKTIHSTGNYTLDRVEIAALPNDEGKSPAFDVTNSVLSFDYFENILEPSVTIRIVLTNSVSLIDSIPIRGGERVDFSISTGNGTFEPSETLEFYVHKISDIASEDLKETFVLHLVTKDSMSNETTRCERKYQRLNISEHVKSILKDVLGTENFSDENIEKTSNPYTFIGCNRKPFHTLQWLSPKSIPASEGTKGESGEGTEAQALGTAGFLFYENRDGYNFKSIDNLVSDTGIGSADDKDLFQYEYTGVIQSGQIIGNPGPIINFSFDKHIDVKKALRLGLFNNHTIFYDALKNEFHDYNYKTFEKLKDNSSGDTAEKYIDKEVKFFKAQSDLYGKGASRLLTRISDHGTLESGISDEYSGRSNTDMAKSFSRYNLLFSQALNILVPCNIDLKVGDKIFCEFPERNSGDKSMSGFYLIRELRHHFVTNQNVTSLKLMSDTYNL